METAVTALTKSPNALEPAQVLERIFRLALLEHPEANPNAATSRFLELLFEELLKVKKLQDTFLVLLAYRQGKTQNDILKLLEERLPASPDLHAARTTYLDYLIRENQYLDPKGIKQTARSVTLPLDEIYVHLTAERRISYVVGADKTLREEKEGRESKVEAEAEGGTLRSELRRMETKVEKVELPPTVRNLSRIVILGDPGAGKTTLVRFLTFHFAREIRDTVNFGVVCDKEGNEYGPARLPILLRVSVFADAYAKNRNLSLREFLPLAFGDSGVDCGVLKEVFSDTLQSGNTLILLDGLDEIVDSGDRSAIVGKIESFAHGLHPENRFVITSRIAGYRQAQLNQAQFPHFTLQDLERPQIEQFLNRWCVAVECFHTPDAPKETQFRRAQPHIAGILKAVDENPGVARLASNPLMLTILALIHRTGARLPSRRVELYELAVETLLEDWQLPRVGEKNIVKVDEADRLLAPLAYWMHQHKPTGLISKEELEEKLSESFARMRGRDVESDEVRLAVTDFLRRVREHTGIFVERAPKQFGFMHLTFEEYFTAREITRRAKDMSGKIYPYRHNPRWLEPILLAVASRTADDAADIIRTAILSEGEEAQEKGFKPSLHKDILHRDLLLAVRCIGDCEAVEPRFRKEVIERVLQILFDVTRIGVYRPLQNRILTTLESLHGCDACGDAVPIVLELLCDEDRTVRGRAAEALGRLGDVSTEVVNGLLTLLPHEGWFVNLHVQDALERLGAISSEVVSSLLAWLCDANPLVRVWVVSSLRRLGAGNAEVVTGLLTLLRDENSEVRLKVAEALGYQDARNLEVVSGLRSLLHDQESFVRVCAAEALVSLGVVKPIVVSDLLGFLRDTDWRVRSRATYVLGKLGVVSHEVVRDLVALLKNDNLDVKIGAARTLCQLGAVSQVTVSLVGLLRDENSEVRVDALVTLQFIDFVSPEIVSVLVGLLRDEDSKVREEAVNALSRLSVGHPEVVDGLLPLLRDENSDVQMVAAAALARLGAGRKEVIDGLVALYCDENLDVRVAAAEALARLGVRRPGIVDGLMALLHVAGWHGRARAAIVLGQNQMELDSFNQLRANQFREEVIAILLNRTGFKISTFINNVHYQTEDDAFWDALRMVCEAIEKNSGPQ
ncbi:MAG TPA: HEAT repeat domain-containing protein [Acidobacteriota bacterium]|nr:HEAT repeat domain-containing protein [Acidobacteriota bacterium]